MITPEKLTWKEVSRVIHIMTYAPCQVKEAIDPKLLSCGLIVYVDEDHEDVTPAEGAEDAFFDNVLCRIKDEWLGEPGVDYEETPDTDTDPNNNESITTTDV